MESKRKIRTGIVVSDKMDKTSIVKVERTIKHSLYSKVMKISKRYKFHDEKNESVCGDRVKIVETRPLSKDKRWRLLEIVEKTTH